MAGRKTPPSQKRQIIVEMGRANVAPCNIADKLGTTAKYVRQVLKDEGVHFKPRTVPYAPEGPWGRPEAKQRMAHWQRAVEGARAAREAMAG